MNQQPKFVIGQEVWEVRGYSKNYRVNGDFHYEWISGRMIAEKIPHPYIIGFIGISTDEIFYMEDDPYGEDWREDQMDEDDLFPTYEEAKVECDRRNKD